MLPAYDFTYSATIIPQTNRMDQPFENLSGVNTTAASGRDNVRYLSQSFIAPFSGVFTFLSVTTGNWDQFLVLYQGSFNSTSPLANAVIANSSGPGDNPTTGPRTAGFSYSLISGQQYYIVTMGETNGERGTFTNTVSSSVPEPATLPCAAAMLGLMVLSFKIRGKSGWEGLRFWGSGSPVLVTGGTSPTAPHSSVNPPGRAPFRI